MDLKLEPSSEEFALLRDYIRQQCGISLGDDKVYLVASRLSRLVAESGSSGYGEFYQRLLADTSHRLRNKVIDAMTTNETLWFRDSHPFTILREKILPELDGQFSRGRQTPVRIWSAACSTGQEPYSLAMTVLEHRRAGGLVGPEQVQIRATDISASALFLARNGRYDRLAMSRGLSDAMRDRYFRETGTVWAVDPGLQKMVTFSPFNLQDSLSVLGTFDIVFLRYVAIYFNDEFRRRLLENVSRILTPRGCLILGGVETIRGYTTAFETCTHAGGTYYRLASSEDPSCQKFSVSTTRASCAG